MTPRTHKVAGLVAAGVVTIGILVALRAKKKAAVTEAKAETEAHAEAEAKAEAARLVSARTKAALADEAKKAALVAEANAAAARAVAAAKIEKGAHASTAASDGAGGDAEKVINTPGMPPHPPVVVAYGSQTGNAKVG